MINSIIDEYDTHFTTPLIFLVYSHFKPYQQVLIKGWSHFSQDQKAINKLLDLQVWKTSKNQVCCKITIEKSV